MKRLCLSFLMMLAGCATPPPRLDAPSAVKQKPVLEYDRAKLAAFEADSEGLYRVAPGDVLHLDFWARPELSGSRVVGPDGRISVPLNGSVDVTGMTIDEVGAKVREMLKPFYADPSLTARVDVYTGMRVTVLGRVKSPGLHRFDTTPTLLEVIARAGSLPEIDKTAALTRCSIIRGRDRIVWIDLQKLLVDGDLTLNLHLKRDDLVYIPDSDETVVYVLGEVAKPGAYRLSPGMSVLDAIAQAGGPNRDAARGHMRMVRPSTGQQREIDLDAITSGKADAAGGLALSEGDVIYAPPKNLARFGYVLEKLAPAINMLMLGYAVTE